MSQGPFQHTFKPVNLTQLEVKMYSNCSEARKVSSGLDVLVFESITGFITLVYNNSSGSRGEGGGGGGGGGAIAPPPPSY